MREDYEYFANDSKMNRAQRRIKLQSMAEEIENDDFISRAMHSPYIQLSRHEFDGINEYIQNLKVANCDLPKIPKIDIKRSHFKNNTFEIVWNAPKLKEFQAGNEGLEVCYTKIDKNKIRGYRYYEDIMYEFEDENLLDIKAKLKKIEKFGWNLWHEIQKWLPSMLRQFDKGAISLVNEDDDELMDVINNIRSSEWNKDQDINGSATSHKIKDLEYDETYLVKARGINRNGYGPFSDPVLIKTPPFS